MCIFYVLQELQSSVDFTIPFRLLRYMVELLNDVFKNTDEKVRERKDFGEVSSMTHTLER